MLGGGQEGTQGGGTYLQTSVLKTHQGFQHKYQSLGQEGGCRQGFRQLAGQGGFCSPCRHRGRPSSRMLGCISTPQAKGVPKSLCAGVPQPCLHPSGLVGREERSRKLTHAHAVRQRGLPFLQVPVGWEEVGVREQGGGAGWGPSPALGPGATHGAGICGRLILFSRSAERTAEQSFPSHPIRA